MGNPQENMLSCHKKNTGIGWKLFFREKSVFAIESCMSTIITKNPDIARNNDIYPKPVSFVEIGPFTANRHGLH